MRENEYEVIKEITALRDVTNLLKEGGWWLFLGTGGWHGSKDSLSRAENIIKNEDEKQAPGATYVTVLLLHPEKVAVRWGEIQLKNINEVEYLRQKLGDSLVLMEIAARAAS